MEDSFDWISIGLSRIRVVEIKLKEIQTECWNCIDFETKKDIGLTKGKLSSFLKKYFIKLISWISLKNYKCVELTFEWVSKH